MYSVLNKLSEYTYFYISKNIISYIFCLFLKSPKTLNLSWVCTFSTNLFMVIFVLTFYLLTLCLEYS